FMHGRYPFVLSLHHPGHSGLSTPSLHDALPICGPWCASQPRCPAAPSAGGCRIQCAADASDPPPIAVSVVDPYRPMSPRRSDIRSEEHTSELQSRENIVCRLLLEKKKSIFNVKK